MLMKLSANFYRSEFACKCSCGFDTVDHQLIKDLERLREHFGQKITINSGCRCVEYNEKVQKNAKPLYAPYTSKSQHLYGRAADIVVQNVSPDKVYEFLDSYAPNRLGLGKYKTFTHIDSRSGAAKRW